VYGWIWRRLPFGLPGKLVGSLLLACAAVALLWYVAFPAIDPYLPFNDGGVTSQDGPPGQDSVVPGTTASPAPAPSGSPSTR
jgi:hypothetical protein